MLQFYGVVEAIGFAANVVARDIIQVSALRKFLADGGRQSEYSPQEMHAEASRILDILERGMREDQLEVLVMCYAPPRKAPVRTVDQEPGKRPRRGPLSMDFDQLCGRVALRLSLDHGGAMFNEGAARVVLDTWLAQISGKEAGGGRKLARLLKVRRSEAYKRRDAGWKDLHNRRNDAHAAAAELLMESGHVVVPSWAIHDPHDKR